jgi:GDP-mannose 6-dehydrogenase
LPHIGKLLVGSIDDLVAASDTIVIAQKPSAAALAQLQASGLPLLDLTRLTIKPAKQVPA